jgi:hypothetical protein
MLNLCDKFIYLPNNIYNVCSNKHTLQVSKLYEVASVLNIAKFPLAPMGVLAHRLRTLDRSLAPPSTRAEIFRRTCLQSQLSTPPLAPLKSYLKFGNPWTTFQNIPISAQKSQSAGGRGGPQIFFLIGILIFLLLRSPCKITKPYDNPFWEN